MPIPRPCEFTPKMSCSMLDPMFPIFVTLVGISGPYLERTECAPYDAYGFPPDFQFEQ